MTNLEPGSPSAALDGRFSSPGAAAQPWEAAGAALRGAELYWIVTVRNDSRPHVTPLLGLWLDGRFYFCTGPDEQKARNLAANNQCAVLTGCNVSDGLDVVVEGEAEQIRDETLLHRLADGYETKYGSDWRFTVEDGAFRHGDESLRGEDPGRAIVFAVAPRTAFGFGKGAVYSQTRWRF